MFRGFEVAIRPNNVGIGAKCHRKVEKTIEMSEVYACIQSWWFFVNKDVSLFRCPGISEWNICQLANKRDSPLANEVTVHLQPSQSTIGKKKRIASYSEGGIR